MKLESIPTLSRLFDPTSVAIVGASDDRNRITGRPLRYMLEAGFSGNIYPVNPRRDTVQGLKCYPDIEALPKVPDVVLIAVPAALVMDVIKSCVKIGVPGIFLLTSGFAESGEQGEALQNEIARLACEHGIRILGPNCLGSFNSKSGFYGTFATSLERGLPSPGSVAIASQSGAYGQHLAYLATRRNLGISHFISTGNELDIELADCIEWLASRDEVKVILAYAEGIRDGERLKQALQAARAACKPVVMAKVGTSEAGARAAASHTAALAGSDDVYDGIFRQFGVYRASSIEEQLDIAYACARSAPLRHKRVALVSVSGGGGVHMADCAARFGLEVPVFPASLQDNLRKIIPFGGPTNPVDVTGQIVNTPSLLADSLTHVATQADCSAISIFLGTVPLTDAGDAPLRSAIEQSTRSFRDVGPVVVSLIGSDECVQAYEEMGFLVYEDPARAIRALGALHQFGEEFRESRLEAIPADKRYHLTLPLHALSEVEVKGILRSVGVATPKEIMVVSPEAAATEAEAMGCSVAMKIVSPDIAHKTEIGGVLLDVEGPNAAAEGYRLLRNRARENAPDARFDGILVSPMAPSGIETIVGVTNDPTFGPVVMFGLGGVLAECYRDVSFRAAPVNAYEAERMIDETRAAQLLTGWRSAPAGDRAALVEVICSVSKLAHEWGKSFESIEINPLRVLREGDGVLALDAVIIPAVQKAT